jgi:hypothetical protein
MKITIRQEVKENRCIEDRVKIFVCSACNSKPCFIVRMRAGSLTPTICVSELMRNEGVTPNWKKMEETLYSLGYECETPCSTHTN